MEGGLGEGIPASRTSNHKGIQVGRSTMDLESEKCVLSLNYQVLDI